MRRKTLLSDLSACLNIKMDRSFIETSTCMNFAEPNSKIKSIELSVNGRHLDCDLKDVDTSFLEEVVYEKPTIKLQSYASTEKGRIIEHRAPNGKYFTNGDLIKAVEETERQTRGDTDWFGGVDCHHVFFEGIYFTPSSDVGTICWGS